MLLLLLLVHGQSLCPLIKAWLPALQAVTHLASASVGAVLSALIRVPSDTLKHRTQAYLVPNCWQVLRSTRRVVLHGQLVEGVQIKLGLCFLHRNLHPAGAACCCGGHTHLLQAQAEAV